jgi:hypothetical protein
MRARLIGTPSNLVERGCGRNVGPARGGREDLSPSPYTPGPHKRSAALGALNGPNDQTGAPEPAVEQPPERGSMNCAQSLPSGIGADMLSS